MRGYSIVELLVSMGIISVLSAIAAPSLVRTYRNYQMDDAASQVAAQLKFTRYEAIRQNFAVSCLNQPQNGLLTMWTDNVAGGVPDRTWNPGEKRIVFPATSVATLVDSAAVPGASGLTAIANAGALTTINPANGTTTFDGRGAKVGGGTSVYWVGNANYGWRAITVTPSGSVQVWSNVTGGWTQLS
jgi:prepilin-type N-terminal cleavage/methylation domain-containing protein